MPKVRKTRALYTLFSVSIFFVSIFLFVTGFLIAYFIVVDRVSEFSSDYINQNGWIPFHGDYFDYLMQLPKTFYSALCHYPYVCIISFVFSPLLFLFVPLYDIFFLYDYSMILNGILPFFLGACGLLWAVFMQDSYYLPKIKPLEFDD